MQIRRHTLPATTPGTTRELLSLHYGAPGAAGKVVIQASLHADEVPAMLVAHCLRERLARAEDAGQLRGEIVLVPYANPVGLSQWVLRGHVGRFDLRTGENFNRHYADLVPRAAELVSGRLTGDAAADVECVRDALRRASAELPASDELDGLRRALLGLAIDADLVLDLHCDNEAVLHLYTETAAWPVVEPLARLLDARLALLASASGDDPFDEACSTVWPRLAARLSAGAPAPVVLPNACVAVTVELRGEVDVDAELAARDADAIVAYLAHRGSIALPSPPALPAGRGEALPLAGSVPVPAPRGGIVVYATPLGARVRAGERIADLVDPATGESVTVASPIDGLLYARELRRYAHAGAKIAKVAGAVPVRTGKLLSP